MTLLQTPRGPSLEELCGPSGNGQLSRPPPPSFERSSIYDVRRTSNPHVGRRTAKPSGAQLAGLRYEKRALAMLASRWPGQFIQHPWFSFRRMNDHKLRYCQPDGFTSIDEVVTIFEVKLHWCSDAPSQLFLYRDVLTSGGIGSRSSCRVVCICKAFDSNIVSEGAPGFIEDLDAPSWGLHGREVGVFLWRP